MIIFKVWKASRLCTAMSAAVFVVMMAAFAWQALGSGGAPAHEEAVPAMAAAQPAEETAPAVTPFIDNLFYLPAPEPTPSAMQGAQVRFELVLPESVPETPTPKRILIYHTHTWEAYEPTAEESYVPTERWRTRDTNYNIVRVGAELEKCLTALGFEVVHEQGVFEPPVLSTAYNRSLEMLEAYTQRGETFDYYIDMHRDAYSEGVYKTNTVTGTRGEEVARLMMLIGKGTGETGGVGFDVKPQWEKNLVLAQEITDALNDLIDGLGGHVKIKTGRFNQHISTHAILVEVGNNKNTLTQALNAMPYLAQAIKAADTALSGL